MHSKKHGCQTRVQKYVAQARQYQPPSVAVAQAWRMMWTRGWCPYHRAAWTCCAPSGDVFAAPVAGVFGDDHAGALEVAVIVMAPIGLVICVHHERSMGLHVVGVKTPATALDRLTVHEATGVVDVVLQGSCICTSLGHTPLPSARG